MAEHTVMSYKSKDVKNSETIEDEPNADDDVENQTDMDDNVRKRPGICTACVTVLILVVLTVSGLGVYVWYFDLLEPWLLFIRKTGKVRGNVRNEENAGILIIDAENATIYNTTQLAAYDIENITSEPSVSTESASICLINDAICENFVDILKKPMKLVTKIPHKGDRLSIIDGKIWAPSFAQKQILIYNTDGKLEKTLKVGKSISIVYKLHNNNLVCAGSGVYTSDENVRNLKLIRKGVIDDVTIHGCQLEFSVLFRARDNKCQIITYTFNEKKKNWLPEVKVKSINNPNRYFAYYDSKFYTSSFKGKNIVQYIENNGVYESKSVKLSGQPNWFSLDRSGNMLVGGYVGKKYYDVTISPFAVKKRSRYKLSKIEGCTDMVVDSDKNVWLIQGMMNKKQLIKYSSK